VMGELAKVMSNWLLNLHDMSSRRRKSLSDGNNLRDQLMQETHERKRRTDWSELATWEEDNNRQILPAAKWIHLNGEMIESRCFCIFLSLLSLLSLLSPGIRGDSKTRERKRAEREREISQDPLQ